MKEVKKMSLGECKSEKQRLRDLFRGENWTTADIERYRMVCNKIKFIERGAAWVLGGILLFALGFLHGCGAVQGLGRDVTWFGEAGQQMLEHGHEAGTE